MSNFVFKKPTFRSTQYFWESVKSRARRSRFILQEGVIKDRMKQVRYTQGWPSGLRRQTQELLLWDFWYTNVCVGSKITPVKFCVQKGNILIEAVSNPTPVKFCVQKANISVEAVFLRVKSRARRSRFHIKRRCYRRQDEASVIYSRLDDRAVQGARLKKFSFETSGTRMCAWVRIPLLSNFAFKKPTFWSKQ